jgi:hypothetical protein
MLALKAFRMANMPTGDTMSRKLRGGSSLKPRPDQRIGIDERAALGPRFSKN